MSIKRRFLFSVGANVARAAVSLMVGLLVARGLGPADYGNLAYLLGSFWAIRALLDMGASSALFTFIAKRQRNRLYYLVYFGWLTFQLLLTLALVAALLPQFVVDRFWLGQDRELILLALLATFLQNQVWQTVVQLHEAQRKTFRVQTAGLLIIVSHLMLVVLMLSGDWLSIQSVLWALVAEYLAAAIWLTSTLRVSTVRESIYKEPDTSSLPAVLAEYFDYCKPMLIIGVFTFFYEMTDRWLLQRYGGANQQAFYQVALQLSTISLLATTSILNILWKELAEACEQGNHSRVVFLHQRATQLMVLLSATVACFLAPWAEQLVAILLGDAYRSAWPVLFLMLFHPIYQSMGQVNGALFMATAQTRTYMKLAVMGMLISIPVSYLLVAPVNGQWIPGLQLGAMGLGIKIVGLNILFVNIQSWVIARRYCAMQQWRYQASSILLLLAISFAAHHIVRGLLPGLSGAAMLSGPVLLLGMVCAGMIYLALVFALVFWVPGIIGLDHKEVGHLLDKIWAFMRIGFSR